jgi:hypothetical protein
LIPTATPIEKTSTARQNLLQEKCEKNKARQHPSQHYKKLPVSKPNITIFPPEAEPAKFKLLGTEDTNSL